MQNNKITENVYAMKRMKSTIYERKGMNMLTMWTTRREEVKSEDFKNECEDFKNDYKVENDYKHIHKEMKNMREVKVKNYIKDTTYEYNPYNYKICPNNNFGPSSSFKFNFLIGSINKQNINFNAHKNTQYKSSTFMTTRRIIGNTVEINDFDGIRTDPNRKESNFRNPLVYNHFLKNEFKTHQGHQNQVQNLVPDQNTKNQNIEEIFKKNFNDFNSEILFKRTRKRCPKNHKIELKRKRSNSFIEGSKCIGGYEEGRVCRVGYEGRLGCYEDSRVGYGINEGRGVGYGINEYYNEDSRLGYGINESRICFNYNIASSTTTLRDDILYSIYKTYNMKNNVFYSSFLSKLAFFSFTNIILGLRIFKNYLKITNSKYENLDFIYSVCCVIASKYLDDIHVYNNSISERPYFVNKLEMKILCTLNYSIEFDLINYYNTINEILK